jgi:hypothetical protein
MSDGNLGRRARGPLNGAQRKPKAQQDSNAESLLSFSPQRKASKELSRVAQVLSRYQRELRLSRNAPDYFRYRPVVLHTLSHPNPWPCPDPAGLTAVNPLSPRSWNRYA